VQADDCCHHAVSGYLVERLDDVDHMVILQTMLVQQLPAGYAVFGYLSGMQSGLAHGEHAHTCRSTQVRAKSVCASRPVI